MNTHERSPEQGARGKERSSLRPWRLALGPLLSAFCFLLSALASAAGTNYVWQDSPSPGPPYTTWESAAHTIQEAVDAALPGDTVLVTNGAAARITCSSSSARRYTLLRCTDLANPVWEAVPTQTDLPGTDSPLVLADPAPPPAAFYRVSARFP
jgi:hypothetical protein